MRRCNAVISSPYDLYSQLQQNIESLKKRGRTAAEAKAALAYNEFLAKVARLALRAMNGNPGKYIEAP
jgi:hypothetical protein